MLKTLLTLTVLATSQISFAQIGQTGCTQEMITEASHIYHQSVEAYEAGAVSSNAKFIAQVNLIETMLCAGEINKKGACPRLKAASEDLVKGEKASVGVGASTYSDLISATTKKNEIEIYCK